MPTGLYEFHITILEEAQEAVMTPAQPNFDENLIGKYVVEDDNEMYIEIKADETAEISINAMSG